MSGAEVSRWLELRAIMRNGGWTKAEEKEYAALDQQLAALEEQEARRRLAAASLPDDGAG